MTRRSVVFTLLLISCAFVFGVGIGAVGKDVFAWRIDLYARKVLGRLPELSWTELLSMTALSDRFRMGGDLEAGRSLDAAMNNPLTSDADILEGERVFQENCAVCHGADASGGAGPSLIRPTYDHGDSDFALYRVIRDGIPQTAMQAIPLNATKRWQVVGYLSMLQQKAAGGVSLEPADPVDVSDAELLTAASGSEEWLTYSGNLKGWRYSSLSEITSANVSDLQLVWTRQFPSQITAQSSTPLALDGKMFVTESPSNAYAVDLRTGAFLWSYDRPMRSDLPVCCGAVNRGMAVHGDLVYLATLDAHLVALDSRDGQPRWDVEVASVDDGYTMTVAPLAFSNLVVVGVSGGEYGIRGFIVAYDAETGEERWRFNTIPGPGEPGHETWLNDAWRTGGGPTWVTGSYDPELDLLYWGVGNPAPDYQGASRPGDNLYTNSVVAVRGQTGELVWHFQFTPHGEHDWDSTQTPVLTDLEIAGKKRRVILWANRNGFYYVLDRENGEFLKGLPYVRQNWAAGLDAKGRPILAEAGDIGTGGRRTFPGVGGGTNWYPPAYDPGNGLVFVHANDQGSIFTQAPVDEVVRGTNGFYVASGAVSSGEPILSVRALDAATGALRWRYDEDPPTAANGWTGLLATEGGLVFGATGGNVFALDSSTGNELWSRFLGGNTNAPPITFSLDGRQMIAVWGGRALFLFSL